MTNPGRWLSHQSHAAIAVMRRLHADGVTSMAAVCAATGRTESQIRALLKRTTGQTRWPVEISERFLALPTRRGAGPSKRVRIERPTDNEPDEFALARRIEQDQAELRARQLHWLEVEQETYRLPKRGRPIWQMPA